jgi:hypothetical protein
MRKTPAPTGTVFHYIQPTFWKLTNIKYPVNPANPVKKNKTSPLPQLFIYLSRCTSGFIFHYLSRFITSGFIILSPLGPFASLREYSVPIYRDPICRQQISCQFALIRGKKNRTSALPQPQISKSIKTHLFPTTFNQNHTKIVQNHIKTILLFNTFYQNFFLFAFLR